MNTTKWIAGILMAGTLVLAGCGKPKVAGPQPMQVNGVKVDLPKMQAAFPLDKPEFADCINKTRMCIRYGKYAEALPELDKLAATPGLTDAQKAVVNEVIEQMKQVAAKAPPRPAQ